MLLVKIEKEINVAMCQDVISQYVEHFFSKDNFLKFAIINQNIKNYRCYSQAAITLLER